MAPITKTRELSGETATAVMLAEAALAQAVAPVVASYAMVW